LGNKLKRTSPQEFFTGILNWGSFLKPAAHLLICPKRPKSPASFIDWSILDNFKRVNDTYGNLLATKYSSISRRPSEVLKKNLTSLAESVEKNLPYFSLNIPQLMNAFQLAEKLTKNALAILCVWKV